jgi:hypothetical protein
MSKDELLERYNYHSFIWELVDPWMRFHESPSIGETAPDFPLWHLDGTETNLRAIWEQNAYTLVEFGSYT